MVLPSLVSTVIMTGLTIKDRRFFFSVGSAFGFTAAGFAFSCTGSAFAFTVAVAVLDLAAGFSAGFAPLFLKAPEMIAISASSTPLKFDFVILCFANQ